jgi:hypothetical protein
MVYYKHMRACKHYRYSNLGDETDIIQADLIWNAWIRVYDGFRLVYSSYSTGLFWEYLIHLIKNPDCAKEIGVTKQSIKKRLKEIEKEWEIVNN